MAQIESGLVQRKEDPSRKLSKGEALKKLHEQKERDKQMVTGVFRYIEHPGQTLRFRFHKYQEDGFPEYELTDGKTYNLPRMIAIHLNNEVAYRQYSHLPGGEMHAAVNSGSGRYIKNEHTDGLARTVNNMYAVKRLPRCEFRPLMFMEDDLDLQPKPDLVQVTHVS